MRPVEGLSMVYHWNDSDFPIPEGATAHETLIRNVWWVRTKLISTRNWDGLRRSASEVQRILTAMSGIAEGRFKVRVPDSPGLLNVSDVAPAIAVDYAHIQFHDKKNTQTAYQELYRGGWRGREQIGHYGARAGGEEDHGRENELLPGYTFAVEYLWSRLLSGAVLRANQGLFSRISAAPTWEKFDDLFGAIGRFAEKKLGSRGLRQTLSNGLDFERTSRVSAREKASLLMPTVIRVPRANRFDRIFEMRPVRVGASHEFSQLNYFRVLFTGLLLHARSHHEKVRLIRLVHPDSAGHRFSYALFVPAFGTFLSNASEYWLMIDAATDFSGNGGRAKRIVDLLIAQAGKSISVREFEVSNVEDLERYVESKQIWYLRSRVDELSDLLGSLRGGMAETLVAELLRREQKRVIDLRRSLNWLAGKQVDVIAFEPGTPPRILLIECKPGLDAPSVRWTSGDVDLASESNRDFVDALQFVRSVDANSIDTGPLYEELGLEGSGAVAGVVASVGFVEPRASKMLEAFGVVWDWPVLSERFAKAKINRSLWQPLERFAQHDDVATRVLDLRPDFFSDLDVSINK